MQRCHIRSSCSRAMSQAVHLIARNIPGYGPSEGMCLPQSGISVKSVAAFPRSSCSNNRTYSQVRIGSLKCASGVVSFVCRASSGGPRRNLDFSKQNRQGFSQNRNKQNDERDRFENLDESERLTSKNRPILSLSNTPKFQATAAPGAREKEIVELFRKVQSHLPERTAVNEEKKVEASKGKGKDSEAVDSLLKLLKKHSTKQVKKEASTLRSGDIALDQPEQNGTQTEDRSTDFLNSNNKQRSGIAEPNSTSPGRPPSNFRRRSPVPRVKFQPIYSSDNAVHSTSYLDTTLEKKKKFEVLPDNDEQPELEIEEPDLELEQEQESSSYPDGDVFDELSEEESSDTENTDEDNDKQQPFEHEDLSSLKLPELRAVAKSRGVKGFSKMRKGELVELLSGSSTRLLKH